MKGEDKSRWVILFIIVAVLSLIAVSALTLLLHKLFKPPGHRPRLPGKVISFSSQGGMPLDPAHPAKGGTGLAEHLPANG